MEKTAKIVSVTEKSRTNPKTQEIVYFSTVKMDNWDEYPISRGKPTSWFFKEWQELIYKVEKINEYDKIVIKEDKPAYSAKAWFSKNYNFDSVTMCMSYSKDLCINGKIELKDLITTADKIYNWCMTKFDNKPVAKVEPVVEKKVEVKKPIEIEDDWLPF